MICYSSFFVLNRCVQRNESLKLDTTYIYYFVSAEDSQRRIDSSVSADCCELTGQCIVAACDGVLKKRIRVPPLQVAIGGLKRSRIRASGEQYTPWTLLLCPQFTLVPIQPLAPRHAPPHRRHCRRQRSRSWRWSCSALVAAPASRLFRQHFLTPRDGPQLEQHLHPPKCHPPSPLCALQHYL